MKKEWGRILFAAGIVALVSWITAFTFQYRPRARLVPLVIALPTLALAVYQMLSEISPARAREGRTGGTERPTLFKVGTAAREIISHARAAESGGRGMEPPRAVAWLAALVASIWLAGILPSVALFLLLFIRSEASRSWLFALAAAFAASIAIYGSLALLCVEMYQGFLRSLMQSGAG